jgi:hypothetical protein
MTCSCTVHALAFLGAVVLGAAALIVAVEVWHREGQRREQHQLMRNVEGESRP